jgi:hypothetical protein
MIMQSTRNQVSRLSSSLEALVTSFCLLRNVIRYLPLASLVLAMTVVLVGCKPIGPATTKTASSAFASVAERTKFLNDYVTFRRTYKTLDFDVMYQNNGGGMVPSPSDWDVRIVATVPASELREWIPTGINASPAPDRAWLKSVPTTLDLSGVTEWYEDGKRVVGIDREKRIVVYRVTSN